MSGVHLAGDELLINIGGCFQSVLLALVRCSSLFLLTAEPLVSFVFTNRVQTSTLKKKKMKIEKLMQVRFLLWYLLVCSQLVLLFLKPGLHTNLGCFFANLVRVSARNNMLFFKEKRIAVINLYKTFRLWCLEQTTLKCVSLSTQVLQGPVEQVNN